MQIRKESHPDVRFEVFERLNTGATKLNDQEIRNCVYRGTFNNFLRRQARNSQFQKLIGLTEPDPRMSDVELVLRFTAFWDQTYLNFGRRRLKFFLNKQMDLGEAFPPQRFVKLERAFQNAVRLSYTVFGGHAFRRFTPGTKADKDGKWEKQINKALFDIIMWGFTRYTQAQVVPVADIIFEELVHLMSTDREFTDAVTFDTANDKKVLLRFSRWQSSLSEILSTHNTEPRSFTIEWKKKLFEDNPVCKLCGQQIRSVDDAHVHHVEHYWRGGKTVPENSALTHRYCNLAEGGGR